jgi:hypothetical protein
MFMKQSEHTISRNIYNATTYVPPTEDKRSKQGQLTLLSLSFMVHVQNQY